MKIRKRKKENKLNTFTSIKGYDYYLGLDWSQEGYSLARITAKSQKPKYWQGESKIEELKE
ncbi:MAG: hypothetical protein PVH88_18040, partial [Ignavibacteria bacterium]